MISLLDLFKNSEKRIDEELLAGERTIWIDYEEMEQLGVGDHNQFIYDTVT